VISATPVFSQACLVAGTTIGGGFLALPLATAPLGAVPATVGLVLTWLVLLSSGGLCYALEEGLQYGSPLKILFQSSGFGNVAMGKKTRLAILEP